MKPRILMASVLLMLAVAGVARSDDPAEDKEPTELELLDAKIDEHEMELDKNRKAELEVALKELLAAKIGEHEKELDKKDKRQLELAVKKYARTFLKRGEKLVYTSPFFHNYRENDQGYMQMFVVRRVRSTLRFRSRLKNEGGNVPKRSSTAVFRK